MTRRPCQHCGTDLAVTARAHARFCSAACRGRAHRRRVPAELTVRPRWVTHTPSKLPVTPTGRPASVTDPSTWSTFEAVKPFDRRGFVLDGDGVVVLDLDHCLGADGQLTPTARAVLDRCPPTYVEVSISGDGLHVFGRGVVERGRRLTVDGGPVEVYGTARYVAVTGNRHPGSTSTLGDLSAVLEWLLPPA